MAYERERLRKASTGSTTTAYQDDDELEELVDAARRGEDGAWRELHARYTPQMKAQVRTFRFGPSDVDEVVQFAWARCFENRYRIRSATSLPGWLRATCRNRALRLISERRRCTPTEYLPEISPPGLRPAGPLDVVLANEQMDALAAAVRGLPERQRMLITALLSAQHGDLSYHRVAEELAIPIGSIGPTRQRAVAKLREVMDPGLAA